MDTIRIGTWALAEDLTYLPEWAAYHKVVGVDKVDIWSYLDLAKEIEAHVPVYCKEGFIEFHSTGSSQNKEMFRAMLDYARPLTRWLAYFDLDEFLVPIECDDVRQILGEFEDVSGVSVNWKLFGSSGHVLRPRGLQIEQFIMAMPNGPGTLNHHVKSIGRTDRLAGLWLHNHVYTEGSAVNELHQPVDGPFSSPPSHQKLQLNHYFTRSIEEFAAKIARGYGPDNPFWRSWLDFERHDRPCTEMDVAIARFICLVREEMARVRLTPHGEE